MLTYERYQALRAINIRVPGEPGNEASLQYKIRANFVLQATNAQGLGTRLLSDPYPWRAVSGMDTPSLMSSPRAPPRERVGSGDETFPCGHG